MKKYLLLLLTAFAMAVTFTACSSDSNEYFTNNYRTNDSIDVTNKLIGTWVKDSANWTNHMNNWVGWTHDNDVVDTLIFQRDNTVVQKSKFYSVYSTFTNIWKYSLGILEIGDLEIYYLDKITENKMYLSCSSSGTKFKYIYRKTN